MTSSAVAVEIDGRGVATVTVDNPPVNVMTIDVFIALAKVTAELAVDDAVRVVVLRSAHPEFFIAHFDVEAILAFPTDRPAPTELTGFHQMCERLRTMPKPTIAVIAGRVGGGGNELAMSCDMRFATPSAQFNQPEVALGILPGGSGTVRLPRLVGRSRALELILGCDDLDAATAETWGLVNRVIPADHIDAFVERLAGRMASFPAAAVRAAKASVLRSDHAIEGQLLTEGAAFNGLLDDDDARGAMQAFLDHGGQTLDGERRLGELVAELGSADGAPG